MQDFKHIRAWQRAHALEIALHKLAHSFPSPEYSHLRSQLTRAAESIAATIVEGCGAATNKEFARFLDMSIKSANEPEHHLLSARDYELIALDEWQRLTAETIEIRKMIYSYRKKGGSKRPWRVIGSQSVDQRLTSRISMLYARCWSRPRG